MRKLFTSQLVPGMIAADDILSFDNKLILGKGTHLTDKIITQLDMNGIGIVFVEGDDSSLQTSYSRQPSHSTRIKKSQEFKEFKIQYDKQIDSFKDKLNDVVERNTSLDVKDLLKSTFSVIYSAKGNISTLDLLHNMREYDDTTYAHCLNVALICNVLATWLQFSKEDTEMATACGLLHDIGKLQVPHDILTKPAKLSNEEYNIVKKHTVAGYNILRSKNVANEISNAALMHHERCDGTGYPFHIADGKIDKYTKIVAIADVYDAMTAARVYRGPLCPFRVIEIFESDGFEKYDVEYILTFLKNVVNTYLQNNCRLSNGQEGIIVYINNENLSRPMVQCDNEFINLAERPELYIEELI